MIAYQDLILTLEDAETLAKEVFGIQGKAAKLDGDVDINYLIRGEDDAYILKVSRPDEDSNYVDFQQQIIKHVAATDTQLIAPRVIPDRNGNAVSLFTDAFGNNRLVRMLSWVEGRLWSSVNPHTDAMRLNLGRLCGRMTNALQSFDHAFSHRSYEWDVAQVLWTKQQLHRFQGEDKKILEFFLKRFEQLQPIYEQLPKSVVHADANDNNIVVDENMRDTQVKALIDYGDAVYTQSVNDLAVAGAYVIMHVPDPLQAMVKLVEGYNEYYTLSDEELQCLYTLIACRLIITVTKSSINREKEPDNEYLVISEKPAWEALRNWIQVNPDLAYFSFRNACRLTPHPAEGALKTWINEHPVSLKKLFPSEQKENICPVDMSVSSLWLGNKSEYEDEDITAFKIRQLQKSNLEAIVAGGYMETRPFYTTNAYRLEGNNGYEYRNTHLGVDFWLDAGTPIHAIYRGEVVTLFDNNIQKDYGPTIILKHEADGVPFYTLYGHLGRSCLDRLKLGQIVEEGEWIAEVGVSEVNGGWTPHLHFQVLLDLLGNETNYPGTCIHQYQDVWRSLCPDPRLLFPTAWRESLDQNDRESLIGYRKEHLGKSLSLSYSEPLFIVRGEGAHLISTEGRKYLDTVNNVAHVGHEHPRVVEAGAKQMGILNTNTRYLNERINEFAEELLAHFPEELCVLHFVNSGSEANELALRMAKAYTGQKDMIAVEVGYHGNANACIDISSYKFDGKGGQGKPEFTHIIPLPDRFRGRYQGEDTGERYAQHVQEEIDQIQAQGRNVAAFIAEPIISCGGQIELPENYLKTAYESVRKAGGVCISDEVQVGFGRVGKAFWGFELQGVIPDIVTMGKPIGNGHPLAAVVCTREVADRFANGMEYFNTFGGNPVSSAIGLEVLRVIEDEKLQENALAIGTYLKKELNQLSKKFPIIADVRGQGLFLGIELTDGNKAPLADQADYLANRMKDLGILMSTDGPDYNVLKIKPPMVFSKENADELLLRLETVFNEDFMQLK